LSAVIVVPADATLRIEIQSRFLEDLLEALAKLNFPIDPTLEHDMPRGLATVEFKMPTACQDELDDVLRASGLHASLRIRKRMLEEKVEVSTLDTESEWGI
jgi:hypothetical protein